MSEGFISAFFGALIGAIFSLLLSIFIEYQRKPKFSITIEKPPLDRNFKGKQAKRARFLRVQLWNLPMPRLLLWLGREEAMHCYGEIQFFYQGDGTPVFSKSMSLRFSGADEPIKMNIFENGKYIQYIDPSMYSAAFYRNCYPGNCETIDIAARFDDEKECYGWSNESYIKGWRNKDWELPRGRFLVSVTIHSAGEKYIEFFKLENFANIKHFRLLEANREDKNKIKSR